MSEVVILAAALRAASDLELQKLIASRNIPSASLHDFYDFAEALRDHRSVKSAVASLPRSQAQTLVALCSGVNPSELESSAVEQLKNQYLVLSPNQQGGSTGQSNVQVLEAVRHAVAAFNTDSFNSVDFGLTGKSEASPDSSNKPEQELAITMEAADRDAGVAAFETMQALTELHFDVDQRFVREVGKRGVGLADLKRLAQHLGKPVEFARAVYRLAHQAKLIAPVEGRWLLGVSSDRWLELTPAERFESLAANWLASVGTDSARELLEIRRSNPDQNLDALFRFAYPFADEMVNSHIKTLETSADLIGLTAGSASTSWFELVLDNQIAQAAKLLETKLPKTQERLIIQADLSMIAPGPLPTKNEIELRRFAETEQISMACTYRLSALSVSHGLETGLSEAQIRELLEKLSGARLPQPVDYLLREANQRFGRLTVSAGPLEARSLIKSSDPILLTQILNDPKLRPFSLRQNPEGNLFSRFEPEVVYFGLREAGHIAVRVDERGAVISPRQVATRTSTINLVTTVANDIDRLREHDNRIAAEPGADDLVRQIEFALKNKSKLLITATDRSGNEHEFLLEPKNLSNGRLRGIDTKAEIERTLPLDRVTSAVPMV